MHILCSPRPLTSVTFWSNSRVCGLICVCVVFQDELDNQNPVLRENHQLHEEVKSWLKEQKVQEIFMQGSSSPVGPPLCAARSCQLNVAVMTTVFSQLKQILFW